MQTSSHLVSRLLAALLALGCAPASSLAADLHWIGSDGTWSDGAAWTMDPGLNGPFQAWSGDPSDSAIFAGVAGEVTLDQPISAGSLIFQTDGYTLNSGSITLANFAILRSTTGTQTIASLLSGGAVSKTGDGSIVLAGVGSSLGATSIQEGQFVIQGGTVSSTKATLGSASGMKGTVLIDGVGSRWNITNTNSTTLSIESGGSADFTVSNGGAFNSVQVAAFVAASGQTANFLISDTGSTFTTTSTLSFGNSANAGIVNATISNGGKVYSSSANIGASSGLGIANVSITGSGSSWTATGAVNIDGPGSLTLGDGGSMTAGSLFYIGGITTVTSKVTVNDGGLLNVTYAALSVGDFGRGTLEVNNGGIVNTAWNFRIGNGDDAVGIVNQNGGTVTVARYIEFFKGTAEYHLLGGTLAVGDSAGAGIVTPSATNYLFELGGGTLQVLGGSNGSLSNYANMTLKAGTTSTLDTPGANQDMYTEGVISGSGSLLKTGLGTLYFDQINTFTGGITIKQGIVNPLAGGLGTGPINFASNSTLQIDYENADFAANVSIDEAATGTLDVVGSNRTLTLSGAITGSGALSKKSTGTLSLTGANNYTGGTTVTGGTLIFVAGGLGTGSITINGGELRWASGNIEDITTGGRSLTLGTNGSTINIFGGGDSVTLSGDIGGTGSFGKSGAGTLILTGYNTYSGGTTTLNSGTLVLASANALPSTGTLVLAGGTLSSTTARTLGNAVTLSANSNLGGSADLTFTGAFTNSGGNRSLTVSNSGLTTLGNIFLSNNTSARTLTLNGAGNVAITGVIANRSGSGSNASLLTKSGSGTVTLSGDNSFTGALTASAGILRATTNANALGKGALTLSGAALQLANDTGLAFKRNTTVSTTTTITSDRLTAGAGVTHSLGTLSIGTQTLILNKGANVASGTAGLAFGAVTVTGNTTFQANTGTALSFNSIAPNSGTRDITFTGDGDITAGAITTASGSLTKSGASTLTLSGTNTYTGTTTVNFGSLFVNGSLANTAVTVASGATLGGIGSIGGATTIQSGATLAAGNSPGMLTFTNGLALDDGAILDFELGTTSDLVRISGGTFSSTGKITINLFDSGGFEAGIYMLFNATGSTLSSIGASSFKLDEVIEGFEYTFSESDKQFFLTATAIPEPASAAYLASLSALAVVACRRRRRLTA